jgi:endonuclease YncB( thermonuclease family)
MNLRQKFLLVLLCFLIPALGFSQSMQGARVRALDGDSFEILVNGVKQDEIRLKNIDAPELSQDYGQQAKAALASMIESQPIRIVPFGIDQYGRKLADVYVGDRLVNKALVQAGHAWAFSAMGQDPSYVALQAQAAASNLGLWALANPLPPRAFRDAAQGLNTRQFTNDPPMRALRQQSGPTGVSRFSGRCLGKKYCSQMTSCAEAQFYMSRCGVTTMDGDHDGKPCELMCSGR